MRKSSFLVASPLVFLLLACTERLGSRVSIKFKEPSPSSLEEVLRVGAVPQPITVGGFNCFFASIRGVGIPPILPEGTASVSPQCLELGLVSPPVTKTALHDDGATVMVAPGTQRLIRLFGVTGLPTTGCAGAKNLGELFAVGNSPQVYEVANKTVDLLQNSIVRLENSYSTLGMELAAPCDSNTPTVNRSLTISHAFKTDFGDAPIFSDTLDGRFPPLTLNSVLGTVNVFNGSVSFPVFHGVNQPSASPPIAARFDFLFDTAGIPLNRYQTVRFEASVEAGASVFSGGVCGSVSSGLGAEMHVYQPSSGAWSTTFDTGLSYLTDTLEFEVPVSNALAIFEEDSGQTFGSRFLHISIRSNSLVTGASQCSALKVHSLSATLKAF